MKLKSEQNHDLDTVLDLSQQMLATAESADWEQLFEIEKQRDQIIKQFQYSEKDRVLIELILGLDESIRELAEAQRASLMGELKILNKGKSAIDAYTP